MTTLDQPQRSSTTRHDRLTSFEARYQHARRVRHAWTMLYGMLFLAALVASVSVSDFNLSGLIEGCPRPGTTSRAPFPNCRWKRWGPISVNGTGACGSGCAYWSKPS